VISFNPKPEAMVGSGMDRPQVAPTIASGFGLNDFAQIARILIVDSAERNRKQALE